MFDSLHLLSGQSIIHFLLSILDFDFLAILRIFIDLKVFSIYSLSKKNSNPINQLHANRYLLHNSSQSDQLPKRLCLL